MAEPPELPYRPPIVNAFASWLIVEAQDILPELALSFARNQLGLAFRRFPELRCSLQHDALFVAALNGSDVWDIIFERNCLSVMTEHNAGCFCGLCETQSVFPDGDALWRDHLFAPFREWVLDQVVPASKLTFERHGAITTATLEA